MPTIYEGGVYVDVPDGNYAYRLAPSAAITADGQTNDQLNAKGRGVVILANITALAGTSPTITFIVEGKDPVSGNYYTILTSAALAVTGLTALTVYPGATAAANVTVSLPLARTFRVRWTVGGTTPSVTVSLGAILLV